MPARAKHLKSLAAQAPRQRSEASAAPVAVSSCPTSQNILLAMSTAGMPSASAPDPTVGSGPRKRPRQDSQSEDEGEISECAPCEIKKMANKLVGTPLSRESTPTYTAGHDEGRSKMLEMSSCSIVSIEGVDQHEIEQFLQDEMKSTMLSEGEYSMEWFLDCDKLSTLSCTQYATSNYKKAEVNNEQNVNYINIQNNEDNETEKLEFGIFSHTKMHPLTSLVPYGSLHNWGSNTIEVCNHWSDELLIFE